MVIHDVPNNQIRIEIPISSIEEVGRYRKSLLCILNRVEIDPGDLSFKNDLKSVYELLNHLIHEDLSA
jgi:hypothetical protein